MHKAEERDSGRGSVARSETIDSPRVIVFPPIIFYGTFLLGTLAQWVWPLRLASGSFARIAGSLLIAVGVGLAGWGSYTMKKAGTNVMPSKPALAIVSSGPFRFTRNPLYLANALIYLGLTLLTNVFWALLFFVPMLVLVDWGVIRREERYLEAKFGEGYLAYKRSVRRWL